MKQSLMFIINIILVGSITYLLFEGKISDKVFLGFFITLIITNFLIHFFPKLESIVIKVGEVEVKMQKAERILNISTMLYKANILALTNTSMFYSSDEFKKTILLVKKLGEKIQTIEGSKEEFEMIQPYLNLMENFQNDNIVGELRMKLFEQYTKQLEKDIESLDK